jgi:hypothetical protein
MSLEVLKTRKLSRQGLAGERRLAEAKSEFNDHCGLRCVIAILTSQVAFAVG